MKEDQISRIPELRRLAEAGDADAQLKFGIAHTEGSGIRKDAAKAFQWFQKAAVQGNAEAQLCVAWALASGSGVSENKVEAVEWYRRSAEQGNAEAQYRLGRVLHDGIGVPQNTNEAAQWYQQAANQFHRGAQWHLGLAYEFGEGVSPDPQQAIRLYGAAVATEPRLEDIETLCEMPRSKYTLAWQAKRDAIREAFKSERKELCKELAEELKSILLGETIPLEIINYETREVIVPANRRIQQSHLEKMADQYDRLDMEPSPIRNLIRQRIGKLEGKIAALECYRNQVLGEIDLPTEPFTFSCPKCRAQLHVKLDESGKVRTRTASSDQPLQHSATRRNSALTPWAVFGLPESATMTEVEQIYRELIRQYNPDSVRDLASEIQDIAKVRTHEYREAYQEILEYVSKHRSA